MKVCVVGAGRAGIEAAREAALRGARVTLVDSAPAPHPDWRDWPALISKETDDPDPARGRGSIPSEVCCAFGTKVVSLVGRSAVTAGGGEMAADAFVLTTGSAFVPPTLAGRTYPGVTVMDDPSKYSELGSSLGSIENAIVAGEGTRGLQIAERLAGARKTTLYVSSWQCGEPSPAASQVIVEAAQEKGVSIHSGVVERAVGAGRLEAVLAGGRVVSSDSLAVVPIRVPRTFPTPAKLGRNGGFLVGLNLRSTVQGLLSAGGCAELREGNPPHFTLEGEQAQSGRISGANATGAPLTVPTDRRRTCPVMGLTWTRMGIGSAAARAMGLGTISERWDERSSCTIFYERTSGLVLGIELVERQGLGATSLPVVMPGRPTLRALAYDCAPGSSDISVVSETARLGLKTWSGS